MKKYLTRFLTMLPALALLDILMNPAFAADHHAKPWQMGLQNAATPVMERITEFHNMMLYIIFAVAIFVLLLLIYVVIRFNSKANPTPATFSHHSLIEVIWTVVPIIILIVVAVPSMKLLYYTDRVENPDMTIKAVGYQWYWGYEYPDNGDISFTSILVPDDEIDEAKGQKRLLSVDNPLVVPTQTNIQVIVSSVDVIHNFAVPSFGIKKDAIPGRVNETWINIKEPGTYYGFCSELCGKGHGFMPIEVIALPKDEFDAWAAQAGTDYASYHEYKAHLDTEASVSSSNE